MPTARSAPALSGGELPILLGGGGAAEVLILVTPPDTSGTVWTHTWSGADWSAPALVRERPAAELLSELEHEVRSGRTMNQELYRVRLFLGRMGNRE